MSYQTIGIVIGSVIGTLNIVGVIFSIYLYFRNPQIKTDLTTNSLNDKVVDLQKQIIEVRETHLKGLENDLKGLTISVNDLSKTVVKLATIIDERIPRSSNN